jgi:hypothetical protein
MTSLPLHNTPTVTDENENAKQANLQTSTKDVLLRKNIRMAHPARLNLNQDLPFLRQLELNFPHHEGPALFLECGPFVRLGEFRCHVVSAVLTG